MKLNSEKSKQNILTHAYNLAFLVNYPYLISQEKIRFLEVWELNQDFCKYEPTIMHYNLEYTSAQSFNSIGYVEVVEN